MNRNSVLSAIAASVLIAGVPAPAFACNRGALEQDIRWCINPDNKAKARAQLIAAAHDRDESKVRGAFFDCQGHNSTARRGMDNCGKEWGIATKIARRVLGLPE